ncbi:MAG: ATP-dependent helicase HrpA [Gammaproteobacteria bacterium]|jgi:ATP-dependent helicase HrpA
MSPQPSFESQILQHCFGADRPKLQQLLKKTRRNKTDKALNQRLVSAITASTEKVALRQQQKPDSRLDQSLPFYDHRQELSDAIMANQVIIVCGETGSGKTTQLPQLCIDLGLANFGMIGHTQPRRIAAQSVCNRIAEELQTEVAAAVGYKIRFGDHTSANGYIKLMTDGILLAEVQNDRLLDQYSTIIIDEAHERSLNIDLLLGYIKQILPKRPDLKVIVTSATIDPERFSTYFDKAPILNISGRTFPVEMRYRAPAQDDRDYNLALIDAVEELSKVGKEDILVFFSGERQIREAADKLSKIYAKDYDILPLYSRLSQGEQQRIFQRHTKRRIVLATNVAETSLTVPGIRYVIDTGLARLSRYSWRSRIQRLPIEKISQASANQRSGRCGRTAPGICIRLYDEDDFDSRPEFTEPEILRTNLASVILQMDGLDLGSINAFDFVESPDSRLINDGYRLLFELQATDRNDQILKLGREIASLPVDPRLAAMLIRAQALNCLNEVLVIVSALSIQDPRDSSVENRQAAQQKHVVWQDEHSDFLFWTNLWAEIQQQQADLSRNQFSRWCKKQFLSYPRIREWQDIHHQLRQQLKQNKSQINPAEADPDAIHRAIFAGIPSHIASFDGEKQFQATRDRQLLIFPGSGLARKTPKWIMAFSLIETTRLFAHGVARFNTLWAMQDAAHLHQYDYYDPHWQARQGRVAAFRNTRIYGLLIEGGKRINFATIDPRQARELFIQRALVEGDYRTSNDVIRANRQLIDHYQHQEDKHRRRDILISDRQLFEFYDQQLPAQIADAPSFESWCKKQPKDIVDSLRLTEKNLVEQAPEEDSSAGFPTTLNLRNQVLQLDYMFDPSNEFDGVTVRIPLLLLNQFQPSDFDRLVPGLLKQKIEALLRSLPRLIRKNFIPVSDFAEACFQRISNSGNLYHQLADALQRMTGVQVSASSWQLDQLDHHFKMHYWLEDAGKCIAQSHDLEALQQAHGNQANEHFEQQVQHEETLTQSGLNDWNFGDWKATVEIQDKNSVNQGQVIYAYPALVDYETSVAIELYETQTDASFYHATGIARLIYLQLLPTIKYLRKNLPKIDQTALMYSAIASKAELVEDMILASIFDCFLRDELPNSDQSFADCLKQNEKQFIEHANKLAEATHQNLVAYRGVIASIGKLKLPAEHRADIQQQCEHLVYDGFLRDVTMSNLSRMPAYFQAIQKRIDNYKSGSNRIEQSHVLVRKFWTKYLKLAANDQSNADKLNQLRWMIEEFRIACFAQPMKTKTPVSEKKIEQVIAAIEAH